MLELRRYFVRDGQMDRMHKRMRDMLLPLFAEHDVPRPVAIWESDSAWSGAVMSWVVPWQSFEQRAETWARFVPIFYAARAAEGGEEFVYRTDLTLIAPWPTTPFAVAPTGCETLWHVQSVIPNGAAFMAGAVDHGFATLRAHGATAVTGWNLQFGPLPYAMVAASWPDAATRDTALGALQALPEQFPAGIIDTSRWEVLDRVPYLEDWSTTAHPAA